MLYIKIERMKNPYSIKYIDVLNKILDNMFYGNDCFCYGVECCNCPFSHYNNKTKYKCFDKNYGNISLSCTCYKHCSVELRNDILEYFKLINCKKLLDKSKKIDL